MGHVYRQSGKGRSKNYLMKYYRHGVPVVESSHTDNKTKANKLCRARETDIDRGVPVNAKVGRLRFDDAVQDVENDYVMNDYDSLDDLKNRIKHLKPFFGGRRMATITAADVRDYITHRLGQWRTFKSGKKQRWSKAQINRELSVLKRAFSLALETGKLLFAPHIEMLEERNVRTGFFEREEFDAVYAHLSPFLQPVVEFAYITGWRIDSEVLTLEWRQVEMPRQGRPGTITLYVGETKNEEGRVFPIVPGSDLERLMVARQAARDVWKQAGKLCPQVFFREVAKGRGGPKSPRLIKRFNKAWLNACVAAGLVKPEVDDDEAPKAARVPHDFRRTACRNLVRAGVPEKVAQQLTGHKTREVFDRYHIVASGDLVEAAGRYDAALQEQKR